MGKTRYRYRKIKSRVEAESFLESLKVRIYSEGRELPEVDSFVPRKLIFSFSFFRGVVSSGVAFNLSYLSLKLECTLQNFHLFQLKDCSGTCLYFHVVNRKKQKKYLPKKCPKKIYRKTKNWE